MSNVDGLNQLLETILKLRSEGFESLKIDSLVQYLQDQKDRAEKISPDTEIERASSLAQLHVEAYKAGEAAKLSAQSLNHASSLEMFRASIAAGAIARKDILLVNGGAAVAFLALFGHFVASKIPHAIEGFIPALLAFVVGVAAGTTTSAMTYVSQWGYEEDLPHWRHKVGVAAHIGAILTWLTASGAFVLGAIYAARAFLNLS